jgi:Xaa-Pro aminopeptidase
VRRTVSPVTTAPTSARIGALRQVLEERSLDAILLSRSANKRYYSGFRLTDGEGPTSGWSGTLLVTRDERLICADSRYTEQASSEAPDWELVPTTGAMHVDLPPLLLRHGVAALGMEARAVSHADWAALAEAAPAIELHAIDDEIVPLRIRKTADEVEAIGRACALTDACFAHLVDWIRPGMTEREVAWELEGFFRSRGAEGLAFDTIVLAAARAAMPHGRPSDARVERGNVLLIDFGCIVDGYRSDMTRTLFIGEVADEIRRHHDAVREAQAAAIAELRPGVDGREIDAVARSRIEADGVEPYGHGLGHGIGLETHEPPALRRSMPFALEAGMVFSVEPGIYLPGVTGIRIEDIVVLEDRGPRLLTASPREPVVIG